MATKTKTKVSSTGRLRQRKLASLALTDAFIYMFLICWSLTPFQQLVGQIEERLPGFTLRVGFPETHQRKIGHLFCSIVGFFVTTFACQDSGKL